MKRRVAVKLAKKYLETGKARFPFYIAERQPRTDGTVVVAELVPCSKRLRSLIINIARKEGWDGCHWDSPFVMDICNR